MYENSDGVYTKQCNGNVSSIESTTTTTVKRTTTTTLPVIVNVNVTNSLDQCVDKKQKSKLRVDNSSSNTNLNLAVQKYDKEWISVFDGAIEAGEVLNFEYIVDEVSNSGYSDEVWNTIRWVWDYTLELFLIYI